jgi:hypothetical protein
MEHQLRSCCFASVQIGAETITKGVPVKAKAKLAYRLHVVGIAPDSHLGGDESDVIGPLAVQRGGAVQVCSGLATAVYLRQHNGKGVLRTGKIVPGTAWVVEMLEVTNSYVREASKPAMRGLHAVGRTEFKCLRSFRNLHRGFSFPRVSAQRFCTMLNVSYKPSCVSFLMLREMARRGMAGKLEEKDRTGKGVAARELDSRRQRSFLLRMMQAISRGLSGLSMAARFRWDERDAGQKRDRKDGRKHDRYRIDAKQLRRDLYRA